MFLAKFTHNIKIVVLVGSMIMLVACGGGRATTTSSDSSDSSGTGSGAVGAATLNWLAPTTYTDDSSLTPAGHNIYINDGTGYKKLTSIDNPSVTTYIVENLSAGNYKFAVTAFDSEGVESDFSNEASVTINS